MVDYTHYIKATSVVDTYLDHINMLNNTAQKQHFLTRLNLCQGFGHLLDDKRVKSNLFKFILNDLENKLNMSFDEMWDESMKEDDFGYKKEIKKVDDADVKFYFGMTEIMELIGILLRQNIELPKDIDKKVNKESLQKMIDIANKDDIMKKDEGTTYVNGIGEIISLKELRDDLVPIEWDVINNCYKKIWDYYINICQKSSELNTKHKRHNNIYGLTHCVINLTNFYTRFIGNNDIFMNQIKQTSRILINLVDSQRLNNYKIYNDDTLAEMLLCIRLCCQGDCIERLNALDALSLRFDSAKLMFREHKYDKLKDELIKNEHTNILYVLNVLY